MIGIDFLWSTILILVFFPRNPQQETGVGVARSFPLLVIKWQTLKSLLTYGGKDEHGGAHLLWPGNFLPDLVHFGRGRVFAGGAADGDWPGGQIFKAVF